jgi:ABC-type transport system substrate-binding protein
VAINPHLYKIGTQTSGIMKITAVVLLLILAVIACGCTTQAPAAATPATSSLAAEIPDLTGTWTGPTYGYEPAAGFTDYGNATMSMIVSEQKGRIFTGTFTFSNGNVTDIVPFSGVIGRDGRTLTIPQKTSGYSFGEIIAPGEIELIYVSDGTHYSSAIDTFKKV